ncbi:hypothetical protein KY334_05655, partial [Candidatus Woesearchaeota archaeon]|nr:hypothetical protein [Candidatus Woesearchaeota archaeon]
FDKLKEGMVENPRDFHDTIKFYKEFTEENRDVAQKMARGLISNLLKEKTDRATYSALKLAEATDLIDVTSILRRAKKNLEKIDSRKLISKGSYDASKNIIKEHEEALKNSEKKHKHSGKLENILEISSIISIVIGTLMMPLNITGNAIVSNSSNINLNLGAIILLIGLMTTFILITIKK